MAEKRPIVEDEAGVPATEDKASKGAVYSSICTAEGFSGDPEVTDTIMSLEKIPPNSIGERPIMKGKTGEYIWHLYKNVHDVVKIKLGNSLHSCDIALGGRCGIYGANCSKWIMSMELDINDVYMSNLPLAHIFYRGECFIHHGAQDVKLLIEDLTELNPAVSSAVRRVLDIIHTGLQYKLKAGGTLENPIYKVGDREKDSKDEEASQLFDKLVFSKVKGLGGRIRLILSGVVAPVASQFEIFLRVVACFYAPQGYGDVGELQLVNHQKLSKHKHIPAHLWHEILSRLPSKSVARFRCVSKVWESSITNPDFWRLHLKNFKNNVDETHLLVVEEVSKQAWKVSLKSSKTFETKSLWDPYTWQWRIRYAIDGLVFLRRDAMNIKHTELRLWNPSINKTHDFPPVPDISCLPLEDLFGRELGFGYDPLAKEYKHIELLNNCDLSLHSIAVYSLLAGTWKIMAKEGCNWQWELQPRTPQYPTSIYLHGCLYFIGWAADRKRWELVLYDLSSEVFSSFNLPGANTSSLPYRGHIALFDGGDSVALVNENSIWAFGQERVTWTKRYSFDFHMYMFMWMKKNNDMLTKALKQTYSRSGREWFELVVSYNLETKIEEILEQHVEDSYPFVSMVFGYVDSLILLK